MDESLNGTVAVSFNVDKNNHCFGRQYCVSDVCGVICAILTWVLLLYGQFCVLTIMMASVANNIIHQSLNFVFFELFFVLAFSAHVKTMFTNPGTVPKGTLTKDQVQSYLSNMPTSSNNNTSVSYRCTKCSCVRPERAHHCSVCKRCIRRMDHHCPWVNNCVGENNQKFFVLFTLYVSILSFQALYWAVWQFVMCVNQDWHSCTFFSASVTTIMLVVLLFESILFSIFTAVMFGTQLSAICSDQTGIESIKNQTFGNDEVTKKSWKNLQVVFGGPFSINWFNPFALPFITEKAFEFSV